MTTHLLYMLANPPLVISTKISNIGDDEGRPWVTLLDAIMHPQGGGQPADKGVIARRSVIHVSKADGTIRHYVDSIDSLGVGDSVDVAVDAAARLLHARWHSAGHLLAPVVEREVPEYHAVGAHHWVGQARVEFVGPAPAGTTDLVARVGEALQRAVSDQLPIAVLGEVHSRTIRIGSFTPVGCGGTHVNNTSEIGGLSVRKVKYKDGKLTIGYEVAGS